ncbi:MAG TPA: sulfocyanin-like copper-binding protein [Actinomycetota bacterium]|jgi:uncharacterized cupredoxin-like copper-binding protein|nr:sulfocyanin-like copper-binding protein [Actinomycetota bacterium]
MTSRTRSPLGVVGLSLALLMAAACSSDGETPGASTTVGASTASPAASGSSPSPCGDIPPAVGGGIAVTERDFAIEPAAIAAPAGRVAFDIQNEGPQTHEFVVFKTNLDPADLPTNADGTVDEEGKGVKHIDEVEDIAACTSESLVMELAAGNYVFICNLPGHYASGMHTAFTVQ